MSETTEQLLPDEAELPTPENFDLNSWIAGVQSTVRSVNIYARADLLGEIDEREQQLEVAKRAAKSDEAGLDDEDEVARLEEQLAELYQAFVSSGITFKVQGRSENWAEQVSKRWRNDSSLNGLSKEAKDLAVQLHQLAESVIQPAGFTYDHLVQLREASEPQVRKLLVAWSLACNQAPQVTVPFSQRSSGRKATPRQ